MPITIALLALVLGAVLGFTADYFIGKSKIQKTISEAKAKLENDKKPLEDQVKNLSWQVRIYDQVLGSLQEAVILADPQTTVLMVNKKAQVLFNTTPSLIIGHQVSELLPGYISQRQKQNFQMKIKNLEAEDVILGVSISPLMGHSSDVVGDIIVIRDVTEALAVEEMKLDFVAIAAHQLRTPLTSVKGYLSVLKETVGSVLDTSQQVFLERAIISVNRLGTIIEKLMNVSKIERGNLKIDFQPVDIEQVVKSCTESYQQLAAQNKIELKFENQNPPYPQVPGDEDLLAEAISNVISNAINFNHPGGQVTVTLERQPGTETIFVTDTGKGIPAQELDHIFQRFYRATRSLEQLSNGLGVGLFTSKSIIESHKGKIWANSLEGRGTTFGISLPTSG